MHAARLTHSIFISPSPPRPQEYLPALQKPKSLKQHCPIILTARLLDAISDLSMTYMGHGNWKWGGNQLLTLYITSYWQASWEISFFRVVLQYPFSNSLDVERQLQWMQQLNPKFQCPVTSCVECQEAAQAATTVTETFKLLVWNTWIRFLNSVIPMASSEVIVSLVGPFLEFWELFVEAWFLLKIPRGVSVFWNLIHTLTKQVMTYRGRSTPKWVVLVQKLANC